MAYISPAVDVGYGTLTPGQGILEQSSTQVHEIGERLALRDGRVFHYAKNGAVALAAGKLVQTGVGLYNSAAEQVTDTSLLAMALDAPAAGTYVVTVTIGTLSYNIDANMYAGSWFCNNTSGYMYKIKSHPAATAGSSVTLALTLFEPLLVVVGASDTGSIISSPYNGTVVPVASASTQTGTIVGLCPMVVTASYYYWCQTWGVANVLCEATSGITVFGAPVTIGSVAGSFETGIGASAAWRGYFAQIGWNLNTQVDAEYKPIWLTIAP